MRFYILPRNFWKNAIWEGKYSPIPYESIPNESIPFLVLLTKMIFFSVFQYIKQAQIFIKQGKIKAVSLNPIRERIDYQMSLSKRDILS